MTASTLARFPAVAAALIAGAMSFGQGPQAQQAVFRVVLVGTDLMSFDIGDVVTTRSPIPK